MAGKKRDRQNVDEIKVLERLALDGNVRLHPLIREIKEAEALAILGSGLHAQCVYIHESLGMDLAMKRIIRLEEAQ